MPELLSLELLEHLDRTLREAGAVIANHWEPGLTGEQIDTLTNSHGIRLPDEAALWWGWHNGAGSAELMPHKRMLPLESALGILATNDALMDELYGLSDLLIIVNEQPWLWFDCRVAEDAPVPVYAGYKAEEPTVAAESIGEMVSVIIAALEAGAYSTDERGEWNEPNWEIVKALGSRIL